VSRRSKSAAEPSTQSNHTGGSMRPLAALGLAIILWLPSGRALMNGDLDITNAAIRFLVAVGVCWAGVTMVATIVGGYATPAPPAPAPPQRRRTDQAEATTTTPNFAAVEMHPEHGNDDAIIDIVTEDA
jgi:hypothetical protein